jgi:hypothetical protein
MFSEAVFIALPPYKTTEKKQGYKDSNLAKTRASHPGRGGR